MLSRVANNLFWMDRYMERSYGLLNLIKTNYNSTLDSGDYSSWNRILFTYMNYEKLDGSDYNDSISIIEFMIFDNLNSNSIVNIVSMARENARSVQEHISRELWLSVNKYYLAVTDKKLIKKFRKKDTMEFLNDMINFHHIYNSISEVTQERGNAFFFMNVGKYIERISQSLDFLNVKINSLDYENENFYADTFFWKNLLISIGGYQFYVKTYKSIFNIENIVEIIVLNQFFPRSISFSINKIERHIKILNDINKPDDNILKFMLGKLKNNLRYTTIDSIKQNGLEQFIEKTTFELNAITEKINSIYFYQKN